MTNETDLVLERTLDAPVDLVWECYTNPEHLKKWFAPKPYEISEIEMDLKPGGVFRIRMTGPDGFDTGHGTPGACCWSAGRSDSGSIVLRMGLGAASRH